MMNQKPTGILKTVQEIEPLVLNVTSITFEDELISDARK